MFDDVAPCCACAAGTHSSALNAAILHKFVMASPPTGMLPDAPCGTRLARETLTGCARTIHFHEETAMKFNTLIAVAVAGAFAIPLGALAQGGAGGTTTAPSATSPQGNPPAGSTAGAQTDPNNSASGATGDSTTKSKSAKSKKHDTDSSGAGSTTSGTMGSGAGNAGSSTSSDPAKTMGTPKSPSSGGASSGDSTSKEPK
jgi:hypothetical protein